MSKVCDVAYVWMNIVILGLFCMFQPGKSYLSFKIHARLILEKYMFWNTQPRQIVSEKNVSKMPERELIKTKMAESQTEMALTKVFVDPAGFAHVRVRNFEEKNGADTN